MKTFTVEDIETFATGLPGAEGIAVANDGHIFIGAEDGWVYVVSPRGEVAQFARLPGRPLGIALDCEENLYVCDWDAHGIYKVDSRGNVSLFADSAGGRKIQYPNYCVFDDAGNLYVTDTGSSRRMQNIRVPDGAIFRVRPNGRCELFADGLYQANGLAMRRGESAIHVIQTALDNVLRIEIQEDGAAGARRVFVAELDGSPDGMVFCENGDLLVVTGLKEIIYRVQPDGQMDVFAEDANAEKLVAPANPAFAGPALDELYVTNLMSNSVSRIRNVPRGQRLYHQIK